ncbi:unnamed protein product [Auanema sp. JU1783]|nr:unnamed protein product [Auanema sp. JU1783]
MLKDKRLLAVGSGIIFWILYRNRKQIRVYLRNKIDSLLDSDNYESEVEVITEYIMIPKEAVPDIIGKNSAAIRKIERQTKVFLRIVPLSGMKEKEESLKDLFSWDVELGEFKINFNVDVHTQSFIKLQSCSRERIELACTALKSVLSQIQEKCIKYSFDVPKVVIGHIIGVGGRNIKKIASMHNVKIRIGKSDEQDERSVIHLYGNQERVIMAKDAICRSMRRQGDQRVEDELEQAFQELSYTESLTGELKNDEYW